MIEHNSAAWQELYRAAIFETDLQKALERIVVAQAAMDSRLQQLSPSPDHAQELRDIEYALNQLTLLRRTTL
ncbi:MAG TPA: hypothetical protein VEV41_02700 [Terriglobales bacterium]|jgi:hypothetical protein|nr:hypothetical protein [Terriglobales bacterium]